MFNDFNPRASFFLQYLFPLSPQQDECVARSGKPRSQFRVPMPRGVEEALGHDCFLCLVSPLPLLPTPCNLERSTPQPTTRQVIETRTLLGHDQLSVHPKYRMLFNQPSQFSRPKRKPGSQLKSLIAAAVRTFKLTKRFFALI